MGQRVNQIRAQVADGDTVNVTPIQQDNALMYRMAACLIVIVIGGVSPNLSFANEEGPSQQPSAKERLDQVLDPEGGIKVYKDAQENTHSTSVLPNGEEIIVVQPPQSPGFNVGPPLQLNGGHLQLPPPSPIPAKPPAPEFPQRACQPALACR